MLLGPPMPAPYSVWRFVEGDLYDIARRVKEYDEDAAVVRHMRTGQLGLARWVRTSELIRGGCWMLAADLSDLETGLPLRGEPDGRVLRCQRAQDGWYLHRTRHASRRHRRRIQDEMWRAEWAQHKRIEDEEGDRAERFVSALRKDVEWKPRAFIGKGIAA